MTARSIDELLNAFEAAQGAVGSDWHAEAREVPRDDVRAYVSRLTFVPDFGRTTPWDQLQGTFSEPELAALQRFRAYALARDILVDLLTSAHKKQRAIIRSPLDSGRMSAQISFICGGALCLRFRCEQEPVYLLQENFAAEALYLPRRKVVLGLPGFIDERTKLEALLGEILWQGQAYAPMLQPDAKPTWGGLVCGHQSPFHFFYFQVPGLLLALEEVAAEPRAIYSQLGRTFLDIGAALGGICPLTVLPSPSDLRRRMTEQRAFVFTLGARQNLWRTPLRIRMMDRLITDAVEGLHDAEIAEVRSHADFVLWAGLTTGKRSWQEEEDAIVALAERLTEQHGRLAVLLDGWTAASPPGQGPSLYSADQARAEAIAARLQPSVLCKSLVGAPASRKIALGRTADFFVANHGTGSLFVSRLCRRPGVTHISNAARASAVDQHIHWRASLIPEELVADRPEGNEATSFHVSYSIDVERFVDFTLSRIAECKA